MNKFDLKNFSPGSANHPTYVCKPDSSNHPTACKSPLVDVYDINSLKMVMCSAAPLTRKLIEELSGLSETSPILLVLIGLLPEPLNLQPLLTYLVLDYSKAPEVFARSAVHGSQSNLLQTSSHSKIKVGSHGPCANTYSTLL